MTSDPSRRRRKQPADPQRAPLFEVRHDPLPPPPQPLRDVVDLFDDLPEARPRASRQPMPITQPRPEPAHLIPVDADEEGEQPEEPEGRSTSRTPRRHAGADPSGPQERPAPRAGAANPHLIPAGRIAPIDPPMRRSLAGEFAELRQASMLVDHQRRPFAELPVSFGLPALAPRGRLGLLLLVAMVCGVIVWRFASTPARTYISAFDGGFAGARSGAVGQGLPLPNVPPGEHTVVGGPTVSADLIDAILAKYGSPAQGTGRVWVELGARYGIDPAYPLAFFIHESSAGTNPGWAGLKPGGGSTHNIGNIICAGYATCFGRFRDYASWDEGIEDWYKLISQEYIGGRGAQTVEQIIPIYAPASDNNDVPGYIQAVVNLVASWREGVVL